MIKSMTGYGRARQMLNKRDITIEIRSVNNRYLDCTVKMPRIYLFAEDALKQRIRQTVSRGKIDVFITVDTSAADTAQVSVNRELAESYLRAMRELAELVQHTGGALPWEPDAVPTQEPDGSIPTQEPDKSIPTQKSDKSIPTEQYTVGIPPQEPEAFALAREIARFPDVLNVTKSDENLEQVSEDLCLVLDEALEAYQAMRAVEGAKLADDLTERLDRIDAYTAQVEARSPQTVAEYREKLLRRMREALENVTVDEQRILTEAAIYADKVAVDEETVRLRSHTAQMRTLLQSDQPQGRRMDFLIQEINRESNTIGSKCSDVEIARIVVELKAEVEKMREQVQNVE